MSAIEKIYNISLDIKKETVRKPFIEFVQGDTLNKINITILNEDTTITLSNYTYKIICVRPDNIHVECTPTIVENKLVYDVGTTEINVAGVVQASIEVYDGLERITVKRFTFTVVETFNSGTIIDSTTNYPSGINKNFIYTQSIPLATWNITHNLNKYCSVVVVDSADNVVIGDIQYIDENHVKVTFNGAFSGKAYLN